MDTKKRCSIMMQRWLRQRESLSQDQLAEVLGVSQPLVSQWEHGRCDLTVQAALALADLYRVPVDVILGNSVPTEFLEQKGWL